MAEKKTTGPGSKKRLLIAAALMGQHGGVVGGPARARALSAEQRSRIAEMGGLAAAKKRRGKKTD